jgi:hypothetical protein
MSTAPARDVSLVKLRSTVSLTPNNLFSSGSTLGYVSLNKVHFLPLDDRVLTTTNAASLPTTKGAYNDPDSLCQAKILTLATGDVVALASKAGSVLVYRDDAADRCGQTIVDAVRYQGRVPATDRKHSQFMRGLASDGVNAVYVGTGQGDILVLHCDESRCWLPLLFCFSSFFALCKQHRSNANRMVVPLHHHCSAREFVTHAERVDRFVATHGGNQRSDRCVECNC